MFMAGAVWFGGIRATARTVAPRSCVGALNFVAARALLAALIAD